METFLQFKISLLGMISVSINVSIFLYKFTWTLGAVGFPVMISKPPLRRSISPPRPAAIAADPPPRSMERRSPMREEGSGMTWAWGRSPPPPIPREGRARLRPPWPSTKEVGGLW